MKKKKLVLPAPVYESELGVLYCGDSLEIMRAMPDKCVDLICGSPPYEKARLYLENGENFGIARETEDWVKWMIEVFRESLRICKGLVAYVVGHGSNGASEWSGAPALLMADLLRSGISLRNPNVGLYKRSGIPGSGGKDWYRADYEWIICATDGRMRIPHSDNTACGKKWQMFSGGDYSHRTKEGKRVKNPRVKKIVVTPMGDHKNSLNKKNKKVRRIQITSTPGYKDGDLETKKVDREVNEIANPGNTIIIDCGCVGGGHMGSNISHDNEAPYPEQIPDRFIRSHTHPGDTVMDPFSGSGTTVALAIKNNRKFIGIDLRPSQIKLTKRRIKQAIGRKGFGF